MESCLVRWLELSGKGVLPHSPTHFALNTHGHRMVMSAGWPPLAGQVRGLANNGGARNIERVGGIESALAIMTDYVFECVSNSVDPPICPYKEVRDRVLARKASPTEDIQCPKADPDHNQVLYVYTDGACRGNGTRNARASIGVYFGQSDPRNISETVNGKQTNNVAEVEAILCAYASICATGHRLNGDYWVIVTDSAYAVGWAGKLGEKNSRDQWRRLVPNKALVKKLYEAISKDPLVTLQKVAAHTDRQDPHSVGNRLADLLANQALDYDEAERLL